MFNTRLVQVMFTTTLVHKHFWSTILKVVHMSVHASKIKKQLTNYRIRMRIMRHVIMSDNCGNGNK